MKPSLPAARAVALGVVAAVALGACSHDSSDEPLVANLSVSAFEMGYEPSEIHVPEGRVGITLVNDGDVPHTFVIQGRGFKLKAFDPDGRDSGIVNLPAGAYFYYCDIEGHREAGMEGALYVGEDGS